jgi:HK97 gp10 family phage protein
MSEQLTYVKGLEQLTAALKSLPAKVATRTLRRAVSAGAAVIRDAARANAPTAERIIKRGGGVVTLPGTLKKSIVIKYVPSNSNDNQVQYVVAIRKGKRLQKSGRDAFYASFVEFGHKLVPRRTSATPGRLRSRQQQATASGAEVRGYRYLTRAIDQYHGAAVDKIRDALASELAKLPEFK